MDALKEGDCYAGYREDISIIKKSPLKRGVYGEQGLGLTI